MRIGVFTATGLGVGLLLVLSSSPVPAQGPAPAPIASLAPIDASASPDAGHPLKTLGHVYTSAFCTRFVSQFNVAASALVSNDRHLDVVDSSLNAIRAHYNQRDGALRVYEDRVHLIATVSDMMKATATGQRAIDDLLAAAKETSDSERRGALHESASAMQKSIDRQRAVTYDLTNVIHVLLDKHGAEDTLEYQLARVQLAGAAPINVDALDQPVPEPGSNFSAEQTQSTADKNATKVQDVMQFGRQRFIIGAAESKAAAAAQRVVRTCNVETPPVKP